MKILRHFSIFHPPATSLRMLLMVWSGALLLCGASALAQEFAQQPAATLAAARSLDSSFSSHLLPLKLNASRIAINNTAMLTLGGWAVGNMLINGLAMTRSAGSAYYFQQMNLFWNIVNLGIAGAGFWGTFTETPAAYTLYQSLDKQASIESLLLLNAGLDVAYMLGRCMDA